MPPDTTRCGYGLAHARTLGRAYDEETFRHLLAIERRRAKRASRSLVLVWVKVDTRAGKMSRSAAAKVLAALWLCVREVDFVGWFHERRLAGAILVQGRCQLDPEAPRRIRERVAATLRLRVPAQVGNCLELRVLQLRPRQREHRV